MKNVSRLLMVMFVAMLLVGCASNKVAPDTDAILGTDGVAEQGAQDSVVNLQGLIDKTVNTQSSFLSREGEKVIGKHRGKVKIKDGQLTLSDGNLVAGSFVIDMNAIIVEDGADGLLAHLRSDDFFAVETYPESTLVITSTRETGDKDTYSIGADLTIKDITNQVFFDAIFTPDRTKATANFEIDRTLWDIKFRSTKFFDDLKDSAINDKISFQVSLDLE